MQRKSRENGRKGKIEPISSEEVGVGRPERELSQPYAGEVEDYSPDPSHPGAISPGRATTARAKTAGQ